MIDDSKAPSQEVTERTFTADKEQGRSEPQTGFPDVTCKNCVFWGGPLSPSPCRRHAPPWIYVHMDDWCGDWILKDYEISLEMVLELTGLKPRGI